MASMRAAAASTSPCTPTTTSAVGPPPDRPSTSPDSATAAVAAARVMRTSRLRVRMRGLERPRASPRGVGGWSGLAWNRFAARFSGNVAHDFKGRVRGRRPVVSLQEQCQYCDVDPKRLKAVRLFSGLSKTELEKLSRWADVSSVDTGETLAKEGQFAHEFFVIEAGTAEVVQNDERIAELGPGDFFGEIGLLETGRRT